MTQSQKLGRRSTSNHMLFQYNFELHLRYFRKEAVDVSRSFYFHQKIQLALTYKEEPYSLCPSVSGTKSKMAIPIVVAVDEAILYHAAH